jgi:hypothetical protein
MPGDGEAVEAVDWLNVLKPFLLPLLGCVLDADAVQSQLLFTNHREALTRFCSDAQQSSLFILQQQSLAGDEVDGEGILKPNIDIYYIFVLYTIFVLCLYYILYLYYIGIILYMYIYTIFVLYRYYILHICT